MRKIIREAIATGVDPEKRSKTKYEGSKTFRYGKNQINADLNNWAWKRLKDSNPRKAQKTQRKTSWTLKSLAKPATKPVDPAGLDRYRAETKPCKSYVSSR